MEMVVDGSAPRALLPAAPSVVSIRYKMSIKHETDPCDAPKSLLEFTSVAVATRVDVDEIAFHYDYLPANVRQTLLHHIQDDRLRRFERALVRGSRAHDLTTGGFVVPVYESDLQHEWQRRCDAQGYHVTPAVSTDTLFQESGATARPRNARRVFWEHHFRNLVRASPIATSAELFSNKLQNVDMALYQDVVETLKLNARDLKPRNVSLILQLPRLKRLELHHLTEQHQSFELSLLEDVVSQAPPLQELCFFHGRLTAVMINRILTALLARSKPACHLSPVVAVELISVKLKNQTDHRQLVTLFERLEDLTSVRISSTVSDFDNRRLVSVLLASPQLESLSLEHNDLEDAALAGISSHATPLSLKCLRLGSNALSPPSIRTLATLSLDGLLVNLQRLELRGNQEIGDAGIAALSPMLQSPASRLAYLDLRNCHFGVDGALALLHALSDHKTLVSLDLSQNFFGSSFGDVLADFLLTNDTLQRLHINYVGLGYAGCTTRLQLALRTNMSLCVLSIGANRLRDHGAALLLAPIATRSRAVAYEAVDLSGNLLTLDGVIAFKRILERDKTSDFDDADEPCLKKPRLLLDGEDLANKTRLCQIEYLGLLNNDLAGQGDSPTRAEDAVRSLERLVGRVYSNEWTTRRNVYDDEV